MTFKLSSRHLLIGSFGARLSLVSSEAMDRFYPDVSLMHLTIRESMSAIDRKRWPG